MHIHSFKAINTFVYFFTKDPFFYFNQLVIPHSERMCCGIVVAQVPALCVSCLEAWHQLMERPRAWQAACLETVVDPPHSLGYLYLIFYSSLKMCD